MTVMGDSHPLPLPFFVLATQNPIELEGTYPLPEAQLDRFMFNVVIDYLPEDDEVEVVAQTTSHAPEAIQPLFSGEDVLRFQALVKSVPIAKDIIRYAVKLASASRPGQKDSPEFSQKYISWGAGLRGAQFLVLGAKVRALLQNRAHVVQEDIDALAKPSLRHRILINYRAEAENITVDQLIDRLLESLRD